MKLHELREELESGRLNTPAASCDPCQVAAERVLRQSTISPEYFVIVGDDGKARYCKFNSVGMLVGAEEEEWD